MKNFLKALIRIQKVVPTESNQFFQPCSKSEPPKKVSTDDSSVTHQYLNIGIRVVGVLSWKSRAEVGKF